MVKVTTSLQTLMMLISDVGKAKKSCNPDRIKQAKKNLKAYKNLVRESDEMTTNLTYSDL